jgi:pantothenate kinase
MARHGVPTLNMDAVLAERAQLIVDRLCPSTRLLVAIAGVPASGKTAFATRLVNALGAQAVLVALDGWHLSRAQLDATDDPQRAHDRRGAHWTFDAPAYVDFIARLRDPAAVVYAPSFDHALKDPTPDAVVVTPAHRIVLIEGLYTMLDIPPWRQAAAQMDERWWIQIDPARAKTRLVKRHVQTGVAKDMDEAVWRAENNDEESECVDSITSMCLMWGQTESLSRSICST